MNRKFENQPIEYARFKHVSSDKITDERGKWECKRKTITRGFDPLLHKWQVIDTDFSFLPIEEIGCFKSVIQEIYVKRVAIGADMKELARWFMVKRKVSVKDKDSNIFLTMADGRIFQSDLTTTAPMNLNYVPEGIKIEKVGESILTQKELQNLERILGDPKVYIKPLCCSELQNGELRLEV